MLVLNVALGVVLGLVVFSGLVFLGYINLKVKAALAEKAENDRIDANYAKAMASIAKRVAENEAKKAV